jgi:formyltetrahydrofolate deformylase
MKLSRGIINDPARHFEKVSEPVLKNSAVLLISCPDQKGLNAAVHDFIYGHNGNILHADEHVDFDHNLFLMRVEWDLSDFALDMREFAKQFQPIAGRFSMQWRVALSTYRPKVALFVSRYDHCLVDLLYRQRRTCLRDFSGHQQSRRRAPLDGILQHPASRDSGDERKQAGG